LAFAQLGPTEAKFTNRHLSNRQRPDGDRAERQGAYGCRTKCDHTLTPYGWRSSLRPSYRTVFGHLTLLIIYHPRTSILSGWCNGEPPWMVHLFLWGSAALPTADIHDWEDAQEHVNWLMSPIREP
jgi:hypothetical protein